MVRGGYMWFRVVISAYVCLLPLVMDGYGWLQIVMDVYEWSRIVMGSYGWL